MDALQFVAHGGFRQGEAFGKSDEVALAVGNCAVEDEVGKQGLDDRLAAALEERLAGGAVGEHPGWPPASPPIQSTTARMSASMAELLTQPVEGIEAARCLSRIDGNDPPSHGGARRGQHRRQLGGGIEGDDGAAIAEQGRHAHRDGLEGAGAGEDEAVGAAPGEVEEEQRRLAAVAPGCAIARIELVAASGRSWSTR